MVRRWLVNVEQLDPVTRASGECQRESGLMTRIPNTRRQEFLLVSSRQILGRFSAVSGNS